MEDFEKAVRPEGFFANLWLILWRLLIAVTVPGVAFVVMYVGFRFLRATQAQAWDITIVAIILKFLRALEQREPPREMYR